MLVRNDRWPSETECFAAVGSSASTRINVKALEMVVSCANIDNELSQSGDDNQPHA